MNANVFFMELRRHRRVILIWCAVLLVLNAFMMFFYPIVIESGVFQQMDSFFSNPFFKGMMTTFGVDLENMTSPLGYYVTYNAVYTMLLGSLVAILLGGRLVAREEKEKTAEFLLTKPVTRGEVLNSKMAALAVLVTGLNVVVVLAGFIMLEIFSDAPYDVGAFLTVSWQTWLLTLAFGAVGFLVAALAKRARAVTGASLGIVLGFYIVSGLSRISESTRAIGFISPFRFVQTDIVAGAPDGGWWRAAYFIGLAAVCVLVSHIVYRRKDILL
ncbi:MAG: hypothetical protein A2Y64_09515 [Candidatus Coatesbacteria bacterium RBG_13_66_14]|uniref:ABC transporter permease n=1 Tax=Candidatus Coatesbacteria bacterium RBG_13_66_14 TaxID=1817816 RepID=A0A1F5F4N7_9BACT|nr:MAG: hypothetical protein A2Y64_09515 [Candidatus Coatesbacteria bacterium RBG_13_66_14]